MNEQHMTPDQIEAQLLGLAVRITRDVARLSDGNDPELEHADVSMACYEAEKLREVGEDLGLPPLTPEQEAQAAHVLPLWTAQLARMTPAQLRSLVAQKREAGDLIALTLLRSLAPDQTTVNAASRALVDYEKLVWNIREQAARWRTLARMSSEQRRQVAQVRQKIAAGEGQPRARVDLNSEAARRWLAIHGGGPF